MAAPVKVSDRLLALARREARQAHRSTTAQIEHWATLGRAVEVMLAHGDVLALKRAGQVVPMPAHARRNEVHELLARLGVDHDREGVTARVRAAGTPVYTTDEERPGTIVEVRPDGTRVRGRFRGRRFVPERRAAAGGE